MLTTWLHLLLKKAEYILIAELIQRLSHWRSLILQCLIWIDFFFRLRIVTHFTVTLREISIVRKVLWWFFRVQRSQNSCNLATASESYKMVLYMLKSVRGNTAQFFINWFQFTATAAYVYPSWLTATFPNGLRANIYF